MFNMFVAGFCTSGALTDLVLGNMGWVVIQLVMAGANLYFALRKK